jgi:RND family efflux transporter MFP subunit
MRTTDALRITLFAALLNSACASEEAPVRQPPPVTVAKPEVRTINEYGIFTGMSRAVESADVVARVAGRLETVDFDPGRAVSAGEVLFTIEPDAYRAARDAAAASVKSAEAELLRAETELSRVQRASENNAVSDMDLDTARASRDKAQAALMSAEANLADANLSLSYTQVRSPISGVVGRNLVDAGNLVGQGGATLLTTVNRIQPIFVYFHAPERLVLEYLEYLRSLEGLGAAGAVEEGRSPRDTATAFVELANEQGFPHEARVDFVNNTVDPNTGTIELRVVVENEDLHLFPGLFVRVKVIGAEIEGAILVPEVAVGSDLGGRYVMVVGEQNIAERQYVELGNLQDDGTIHVVSGLDGSETVIVNGLLFARPGLPVTPLTEEQFQQMLRQRAGQG